MSDRRFAGSCNAFLFGNAVQEFEMEMPMKKASTKFVLLVLGAVSLSAALILPVSAQTRPSSSQNCGNASTARDKQLKPDARCLMTSEQYLDEQAKKPQAPVAIEVPPGLSFPGPHINYNDIKSGKVGVVQGNGGSGGSRGGTSAR
jgi:hypothetical protein